MDKQLGNIIRKAKKKKKITSEHLSKLLGVSPTYVTMIELGKIIPSPKVLDKLSGLLEIDKQELERVAYADYMMAAHERFEKKYTERD